MRFNYDTNYSSHHRVSNNRDTIKLFSISSLFFAELITTLFEPSSIPFDRAKARNYAWTENFFFFEWVSVVKRWKRKEIKANYRRRCLLLAASLQLILFDTSMTPLLISHTFFDDDNVKVCWNLLDFQYHKEWQFYTHR